MGKSCSKKQLGEYLPLQISRKKWLVNDELLKVVDVVIVLENMVYQYTSKPMAKRHHYASITGNRWPSPKS